MKTIFLREKLNGENDCRLFFKNCGIQSVINSEKSIFYYTINNFILKYTMELILKSFSAFSLKFYSLKNLEINFILLQACSCVGLVRG